MRLPMKVLVVPVSILTLSLVSLAARAEELVAEEHGGPAAALQKAIELHRHRSGLPPPGQRPQVEAHDVLPLNLDEHGRYLDSDARPRDIGTRPRRRARPKDRPRVVISFTINSWRLDTAGLDQVAQLVPVLTAPENASMRLSVNGHTDKTTGSYDWNMVLSGLRALAVVKVLVDREPSLKTRLEAHGYGPNLPRRGCEGERDEGERRCNRRVELEPLGDGPAPVASGGR